MLERDSLSSSSQPCPTCSGHLSECIHGDALDRAVRARTGANAKYVHRLDVLRRAAPSLFSLVVSGKKTLDEAWKTLAIPGSVYDRDTWLTPPEWVAAIRRAAGGRIDLDPASLTGNPTGAREWYAAERGENGRDLSWCVDRQGRRIKTILLNPPYSNAYDWIERLVAVTRADPRIGGWVVLPSSTETRYGQLALEHATNVLFVRGRKPFGKPNGVKAGQARWGVMIVAIGNASCATMTDLGIILTAVGLRSEKAA